MKIKFICLLFLLSLASYADIIVRGPTTIVNIYSDAYIEGELDRIVQSKIDNMTFTNNYTYSYEYTTNIITEHYTFTTNIYNETYQIVTNQLDPTQLSISWDQIKDNSKPTALRDSSFDITGKLLADSSVNADANGWLYNKMRYMVTNSGAFNGIKLTTLDMDNSGVTRLGGYIGPYINYSTLAGKPTIPIKVSQLNNDSNFLNANGIYRGGIADPHNLGSYCRVNPYPISDSVNKNVTIDDNTGARSSTRHFRNLQAAYDYSTRSGDNINIALLVKKGETKNFYLNLPSKYTTGGQFHISVWAPTTDGAGDSGDGKAGTANVYITINKSNEVNNSYWGWYNMYWHIGGGSPTKINIGFPNNVPGDSVTDFYSFNYGGFKTGSYTRILFHGIGAYLENAKVYFQLDVSRGGTINATSSQYIDKKSDGTFYWRSTSK